MKLIDVNEAIAQIIEDKIPENYMSIMRATGSGLQAETLNQACDRHIKMLNELQTVEAIPIEFIKQLIEKFDCERGNAIKDTYAHILSALLEFWEFEQGEENEID